MGGVAVKHEMRFVLVAALLAVFAVSGCSTLDGIGGTKDAPAIQVGNTQVWYGRVNTWAMDEGLLKADMEKITKNKKVTGYMIELLSWGRYSAYASDKAAWKADLQTLRGSIATNVNDCRSISSLTNNFTASQCKTTVNDLRKELIDLAQDVKGLRKQLARYGKLNDE